MAATASDNSSLGGALLEDVYAARGAQPDDVRQADLRALDLPVAGLAAQMVADLPDVGDAGRGDRVTFGLQAPRNVDRPFAVTPGRAGGEEVDRATWLAQPEVVVVHELRSGETVVQLDEIEVV